METKEKTFQFNLLAKTVKPVAEKRADKGDLIGALSLLRTSLEKSFSVETVKDIALLYTEMEQYELSNKYWYLYLCHAPEKDRGIAYEELLMNHFCLDNHPATLHYAMQKISLDGYLSDAVLDSGVKEALQENERPAFRLLKPIEKANFSYELSQGRRHLSLGRYEKAIEDLSKIPKGCPQYQEGLEELSLAYYLNGDATNGIKYQRELIKLRGETVISFCHLSGMYKSLKNYEKSTYYYERAKEMQSTDPEDIYRLAFIAFEQEDGQFAIKCMEKIILERAYNPSLLFFYGLALINCGRYEDAILTLKKAYRINPEECSLAFYIRLAESLNNGETEYQKYLPLKYYLDYPEPVYEERLKRFSVFEKKDTKALANFIKNPKNKPLLKWAINGKNSALAKGVVYGCMVTETLVGDKLLTESLINPDVSDDLKRTIICYLVCRQKRLKLHAVIDDGFFSFRPHASPFKDDEKFLSVYAVCVSCYAMFRIEPGEHLAMVTKMVQSVHDKSNKFGDYKIYELCALVSYLCKISPLKDIEGIARTYDIKKERLEELIKLYKECK